MPVTKEKKEYNNPWLYSKIIDPFSKEINGIIASFIETDSSVIDVGCGTGALLFQLSKKFKHAVGIDLTLKMIQFANKQKLKGNYTNVEFVHVDATKLSETIKDNFDYAVMSFVIHEMSPDIRVKVINEIKSIAKKIIIAEYVTPQPKNFWGIINIALEFIAGKEHYRNFKHFISQGGTDRLLEESGFKIEQEKIDKTGTYRIVIAF